MPARSRPWRTPSLVAALTLVLSLLGLPAASAAEDAAQAAAVTPSHRVTVVRVDAGGTPPPPLPLHELVDRVNGPVAEYWAEQTDGAVQLDATEVTEASTVTSCNDWPAMFDQVAADVGFTPGSGKILLLYVVTSGTGQFSCYDELGIRIGAPQRGGIVMTEDPRVEYLAHVVGHALGLEHPHVLRCPGAVDGGGNVCTGEDNAVPYDVMDRPSYSSGGPIGRLGVLTAPHAHALGALPPAQTATFSDAGRGGRVVLSPLGGRAGVRAIRLVHQEHTEDYWIEFRPAAGRDAWLGDPAQNTVQYQEGVLIRRGDARSWLLDATPTDVGSADRQFALPVGQDATIAGGRFVVRLAAQTSGTVTVTVMTRRSAPFPRDRNGDGAAELMTVAPDGTLNSYSPHPSNGGLVRRVLGRGWQSRDLLTTAGDWDGDGRHDLIARAPATGELWLYSGNDAGGVASWRVIGRGWGAFDALWSPGDWDGDGAVDLLARMRRDGRLFLYPGNGLGGFLPSRQVGTGWAGVTGFGTCPDWDGDGRVDFTARRSDGALMLYEANGSGGFAPTRRIRTGWNVFTAMSGIGSSWADEHRCGISVRRPDGTVATFVTDDQGGFHPNGLTGRGFTGHRFFR